MAVRISDSDGDKNNLATLVALLDTVADGPLQSTDVYRSSH